MFDEVRKNRQLSGVPAQCSTTRNVGVLDFCVRNGNRYNHAAVAVLR